MNKRHLVKIWIALVIVWVMSFSEWSFAAEDTEQLLETVWQLLYLLVSALSWIWVFFARWAGEFLTNEWVYGETIWLDVVLWQYRNVVKNMANFGLWFYFVYEVWKSVLHMNGVDKIKDKLVWLLIAWVWIQASWFMTAVVIDISTVTLSAAWAFPSMLISESPDIKKSFDVSVWDFFEKGKELGKEINKWMEFSLFLPEMAKANFTLLTKDAKLDEPVKIEKFYDTLMPSAKSVSGPLYYLWFAILKTPVLASPQATDEGGRKNTIYNTLMQWWTTIVFSIEMLVLLVFAVMRMVYMWVFIAISPIVILLWCIKQASGKWGNISFVDSLTKHFNLTLFFWNAFKPTLIVLWFSLSIIFVSLISSIIISQGQKFDMWWLETQNRRNWWNTQTGEGDYKYDTSINGENAEILIKNWWKSLFEFLLCVFTVILVYLIIKFAIKMWWWSDFLSKSIEKIQSNVEAWIGSMPLVPVAWRDKDGKRETHFISAGTAFWFGTIGNPNNNQNLLERGIWTLQTSIDSFNNKQTDALNQFLGWSNTNRMSETDWWKIEKAWINLSGLYRLKEKRDAITKSPSGQWFMLNPSKWDSRWINEFTKWLKDTEEKDIPSRFSGVSETYIAVWKQMVNWWKIEDNKNKTLKDMFVAIQNSVKAYAEFFWLKNKEINTWLELQDEDISKSEESEKESGEKSE